MLFMEVHAIHVANILAQMQAILIRFLFDLISTVTVIQGKSLSLKFLNFLDSTPIVFYMARLS